MGSATSTVRAVTYDLLRRLGMTAVFACLDWRSTPWPADSAATASPSRRPRTRKPNSRQHWPPTPRQ